MEGEMKAMSDIAVAGSGRMNQAMTIRHRVGVGVFEEFARRRRAAVATVIATLRVALPNALTIRRVPGDS